jgi:hypothetical protein
MADEQIETLLTDASEDAVKATWDFWYEDGRQVDSLEVMTIVLGMSELDVAAMIMTYPAPAAIPVKLLKEAADVLGR